MSNITKIKAIVRHFKIKISDLKHIREQPSVLEQLAIKLNVKLNPKWSFNKKVKFLLDAFNEFSKKRTKFQFKKF